MFKADHCRVSVANCLHLLGEAWFGNRRRLVARDFARTGCARDSQRQERRECDTDASGERGWLEIDHEAATRGAWLESTTTRRAGDDVARNAGAARLPQLHDAAAARAVFGRAGIVASFGLLLTGGTKHNRRHRLEPLAPIGRPHASQARRPPQSSSRSSGTSRTASPRAPHSGHSHFVAAARNSSPSSSGSGCAPRRIIFARWSHSSIAVGPQMLDQPHFAHANSPESVKTLLPRDASMTRACFVDNHSVSPQSRLQRQAATQ